MIQSAIRLSGGRMAQGNTFYFSFEASFMVWLQAHMGSAGAAAASFFSEFGEELVLLAMMGFLYWCYNKELGKYVGTNLVVALVANPMIKNIFLRRRPYFDIPGVKCLKPVNTNADIYDITAQGYSFPSAHATDTTVALMSVPSYKNQIYNSREYQNRSGQRPGSVRMLVLFALLPFLVGLSRIVVGVHYPTDVLCGWLLGIVLILLVSLLRRRFSKPWKYRLLLFLVSLAGIAYCKTDDYFTCLGIMGGFFLGCEFEERFVHFENTRNPLLSVLRIIGGFALYFGLNTVLKLPFSKEFLSSATTAAFLVRAARYCIITFVIIGAYPMVFRKSRAASAA